MNNPHPNDRQLQRYLNKMCPELEFNATGKHVRSCLSCRNRLYTFLEIEAQLDSMPLLPAPPRLEDRIMKTILAEAQAEAPVVSAARDRSLITSGPRSAVSSSAAGRRRSELIHGLIAVAATYLFINSGILGKIMSINADNWGEGVQNQLIAIESAVTRLSMQLLS